MPFTIVRNDITKMEVDAVVNTANPLPIYATGTDNAIYKAAGEKELLFLRKEIGEMDEGEVAITPGLKLPARYIIHAVSPFWRGGTKGEPEKLANCYSRSLQLAKDNKCNSIAFPLISTGGYGYPKEEAIQIAIKEISGFLLKEDMMVYLVVFDHESLRISKKLFTAIDSFIDNHYVYKQAKREYINLPFSEFELLNENDEICIEKEKAFAESSVNEKNFSLDNLMGQTSESFHEMLFRKIDEKEMTNAEVYKRANLDKKHFSKIKNNPSYTPKKETVVALAIGLQLSMDETIDLLSRAGIALSPSNRFDVLIQYFIGNGVYDIYKINFALFDYNLPLIGNVLE